MLHGWLQWSIHKNEASGANLLCYPSDMKATLAIVFLLFCFPFIGFAQERAGSGTVDIILEANTIVPSFYHGRAEPSAGSAVRAIAIVDGLAASQNYTYRWEINGNLLIGDSFKESSIVFTTPIGTQFRIRVDILDENAQRVASNEVFVPLSEPFVAFYENNLLRGHSHTAIGETYVLSGEEVSVRAEPYFMNIGVLSAPHQLAWRVDGEAVAAQPDDLQTITLRNNGGTGAFNVEFSLQNGVAFGQRVSDSFKLTF